MTKYFATILFIIFIGTLSFGQTNKKSDSLQFVEIRDKKQFYYDKGIGKPTVVFLTGLGVSMVELSEIQNEISKITRTISYDRAGIGKSEPFDNERNLENLTIELKDILDKIGINKPIILVGHSMGGWLAQYFTSKYPSKVCGLVILDSPPLELRTKRRALRTETEKLKFDSLPKPYYVDNGEFSATIKSEFKNSRTTDSSLLARIKFPNNIPITFIASTQVTNEKYSKEDNTIKAGLLKNELKTAPQMKLIFTDKSGHFIYEDEPKLVINEIISMFNKLK